MIDDLFTELAVDAVDRLLSPETPRDEADFGLARLNSRLSPPAERGETRSERESPRDFDPELEVRLLSQYLRLGVDDLQQVSPRVHEWLLDRLSHSRQALNADNVATLTTLYFLFPESTVRHSLVGLMVQSDSHRELTNERRQNTAIAGIWDAIDRDEGLSDEDRVDQLQLLAEWLLDYIDLLPAATERAIGALHQGHRDGALTAHLMSWSRRLDGESGARVRRAIAGSDRRE
jgi:hypothetical protein